jgi:uncharacterized protein
MAGEFTFVWHGLETPLSEIAHATVDGARLRARGTQIGAEPSPYELRYEVDGRHLAVEVVGGPSRELTLDREDFFDLQFSPLFNSLPALRDGVHRGGAPRDYTMAFVEVPSLDVRPSRQRYEPLEPGVVRFTSGSFTADLVFDEDGFVVLYPGLAERVS